MEVELTEVPAELRRSPLYGIRWGAIFAGLVVGIAAYLFLMLAGAAAGSVMFGAADPSNAVGLRILVAAWSAISMPFAALVGGYVAARTSGLRRTSDGVLHGVVAWGAALLVFAVLAASAVGATVEGMLGLSATSWQANAPTADAASNQSAGAVAQGGQQAPPATSRHRLRLTVDPTPPEAEQRLLPSMGREVPALSPLERDAIEQARQQAVGVAGTWLCSAIILSLLAGMGGGAFGVRGTRRPLSEKRSAHAPPSRHRPERGESDAAAS